MNRYEPGQGIGAHVDDNGQFGAVVACVSLVGSTDMFFRRGRKRHVQPVAPRSLYIMSGDARYAWSHAMPKRKRAPLRYSITFRTQLRAA